MKTKQKKPGEYRYVPAGMAYNKEGGVGVYIKYGNTGCKDVYLKQDSLHYKWIKTPDREIVITKEINNGFFSLNPSCFDTYLSTSLFFEHAAQDYGIEWYMVNHLADDLQKTAKLREGGTGGRIKIISDSGGFQILMNKLNYVDPRELINWYNANVDVGLVLDVPPGGILELDQVKKLATLQAKNTEILMSNRRPGLEMMNIFHGVTPEDKKLFRGICERDDIDRVAIGGTYFTSIVDSIDSLYQTINTGRKYNHYHVLGVTNNLQTLIFMKMAALGLAPLITSDSSAALQVAKNKEFYMQANIYEPFSYWPVGAKRTYPSVFNLLPSSDPVFAAIKYHDVLAILDSWTIGSLINFHNTLELSSYTQKMFKVIKESDDKTVRQILESQLRNKMSRKETFAAFDYLDAILNDGYANAYKRFQFYMNSGFDLGRIAHDVALDEKGELKTEVYDTKSNQRRIKKVLATYDQLYAGTLTVKAENTDEMRSKGFKATHSKSKKIKLGSGSGKKRVKQHKSKREAGAAAFTPN